MNPWSALLTQIKTFSPLAIVPGARKAAQQNAILAAIAANPGVTPQQLRTQFPARTAHQISNTLGRLLALKKIHSVHTNSVSYFIENPK